MLDNSSMHLARRPLDEQLSALREILTHNDVLLDVLQRSATLDLPNWYLTAGCVVQTVWNSLTGREPTAGIKDYDVFYFDDSDLSWEAEDVVIRRGAEVFGTGSPTQVEIRNEARVHLWYADRFGVSYPAYTSTEDAIDSFPAGTCCVGVRLGPEPDRWRVYAPRGLSDLFGLVVRPNPGRAPREVYEAKCVRWKQEWPELTILPWT
ncbi:nucleotidyltransferase family protein [Actinopolymorpha pittospori]